MKKLLKLISQSFLPLLISSCVSTTPGVTSACHDKERNTAYFLTAGASCVAPDQPISISTAEAILRGEGHLTDWALGKNQDPNAVYFQFVTIATNKANSLSNICDAREISSLVKTLSSLEEMEKNQYELAKRTAQTNIDIANVAMSKGCLDLADTRFKYVHRRYTGSAYEGYRDQARLGVDEVYRTRLEANGKN